MIIIVKNLCPVHQGNLKAFATVVITGGIEIRGCRIIQQPNQNAYVALPQVEGIDTNGNYRFTPVIGCDKTLKDAISQTVLTAGAQYASGGVKS